MLLGYARVSSTDQDPQAQFHALKLAGVRKIFHETRKRPSTRPQLELLFDTLREGDTVVVWKLDRMAGSLMQLLQNLARIERAGAKFRSLTEAIDTSTPAGRALSQMLAVFSEFERSMIRERSMAGLEVARANGVRFGRKPALNPRQSARLVTLWDSQQFTKAELAKKFDVSVSTVKRTLWKYHRDSISEKHANGMLPPP